MRPYYSPTQERMARTGQILYTGTGPSLPPAARAESKPWSADGAAPGGEKFMDPLYACFGKTVAVAPPADGSKGDSTFIYPYTIAPNGLAVPADLGQSYLASVPANAAARIAAIRSKMGATPPSAVSFRSKSEAINAFAQASYSKISEVSSRIIGAYQDTKDKRDIAQYFGVPIDQVEAQAADILVSSKSKSQSVFVSEASKYAPIAATLSLAIGQAAQHGKLDESAVVSLVGHAIAAAASAVVPIVGALIDAGVSEYVKTLEEHKKEVLDQCVSIFAKAQEVQDAAAKENLPIPWHLFDDLGPLAPCDTSGGHFDTNAEFFIKRLLAGSFYSARDLSPNDKSAMQRWWTTALTFMSHPEVFNAFDKLGHGIPSYTGLRSITPAGSSVREVLPNGSYPGGNGALYGGALASDEQVMLVAAPIAIANNLNVDDFARKLWDKSKGWRGADSFSVRQNLKGYRSITAPEVDYEAGGLDAASTFMCPPYVVNAWWLQWASLARDAFELVDEIKSGASPKLNFLLRIPLPSSSAVAAKSKKTERTILGALAAGLLLAAHVPVYIAASPFALVWLANRRSAKPIGLPTSTPDMPPKKTYGTSSTKTSTLEMIGK